ncbi:transcription initiation factor IIA gamma chain [Rozella allomycis CSF55]|uniref:Transcription initiation factor IIA subunit 2 n=1 Tax=Rozella allomycis (strain CSF55) TaxID=988480 RepID=A0A075AVF5_ROZAC|nr:Transcription factor IIA, beta-barrel domain-containing protein [Rozella allomycis CSF55]RKP18437.1 transcription initiation factor IIA gamma chain [Rozella allomycis CSF55]|eukprot:EPZ34243.1 Transcription factor IIA, beta-barrel domain-containing protein [Rozella allomycis CSF55]
MLYYEHYRRSVLGVTLTETLDEMVIGEQITPQLANLVLAQFDQSLNEVMNGKARMRVTAKGQLDTYRFCDDVWTFELERGNFRLDDTTIEARKVKIVACNAKKPGEQ